MALERSAQECRSLPGRRARRWAERDEACPTRVLVVTGTIPGTLVGAEGLVEVVESLARCASTRVTLACADGFGASRYGGHYQRQGVEVMAGPVDWPAWCADRRYHYSHVLVSDEGLTTHLWQLVRTTQPQAMAVLYSERLPFRRAQALGDASWHTDGTDTVAEIGQTRLLRQVEGLQAAWCASRADASLLAGLGPDLDVSHFGAPLVRQGAGKGYADREGVALVATDNFDVSGDAEEPAVRALEELVPAWRRRDMSLRVRVVSDWPTPGLAEAAARFGAELVPSGGDLVGALSTARVVLSPVSHGTSASSWVPAAMAAGTPWLTTEKAVTGTYLDDLEARAVVADVATMGHRGWPCSPTSGPGEISRLRSRPGLPASSPNVKRPCVPRSLLRASTHPECHVGPWNACRRTRGFFPSGCLCARPLWPTRLRFSCLTA